MISLLETPIPLSDTQVSPRMYRYPRSINIT